MTFKEFFNKKDSQPLADKMHPATITGMSVVKDFAKHHKDQEFFTQPKAPRPHLPKQPSMLPYRRPIQDRPIESKPTDFLSRKKSSIIK